MNRFALTSLVLLITLVSGAQSDDVRTKNFNVKKGVAIEGYDPVSYFTNKPLEGKPEITWTYRGVSYRFASAANCNTFKTNPDKYEPAYGGWCAYAMGASGEKVKIDPETFKIKDGKLYLFYNFWGNNTLTEWNSNENNLQSKAGQNWRKFVP
ncbi:MAG TPA: YHS domain-containing (seleno)protein [Cyclobacteriaceae bacterium]|nr:YHS domain-containing (seleno)protein [Cyclobacteriaceae bacterium]